MNEEKLDSLTDEQREALRQKQVVLDNGQYTPIPHDIFRNLLPELTAKYDGRTARDCLAVYMYLHAHVNGQSAKDEYMWAFPKVDTIEVDLGIKRNRIKGLVDILIAEGLMKTRNIPWNGHTKKLYLPLFIRPSAFKDT